MNKLLVLILVLGLLLISCSPSGFINTDARVECYSYGTLVYEGIGRFQMQEGMLVFVENESGSIRLLHDLECTTEILQ